MPTNKNHSPIRTSDILSKVNKRRTLTDKILSEFPGYGGYKEKEVLRETDKLVRNIVYRNMKETSEAIRALFREALNALGLSNEVRSLEKLSMRSDAFAEKILHATHGYSPLMNVVKVDEETLLELMEFDASLAKDIDRLRESVKTVEKDMSAGKLTLENLRSIQDVLNVLETTFSKRGGVLQGLAGE